MDLTLRRFFSHKTVKIIVNVVSYILRYVTQNYIVKCTLLVIFSKSRKYFGILKGDDRLNNLC